MASPDVNLDAASVLEAAIAQGRLPSDARPMAEKIVARLQSVTRIGIMGREQSGKSTIAKLLAGSDVGIEVFGSAPLRMEFGDTAMVSATLTDGSTVEGPGVDDLSEIAELDPALVTLKMPLPALKKISLLELRVSEDHGEAVKALNWALKHTDIAIWCTEFFTGDEQGLWSSMPDVIKDHAMLLRTKADTLSEPWDISEDRLRGMVRGEFAHVFAVSAEQGVQARAPDGSVNKAAMKQSGSTKVISTILRELDNAKRAAADQADFLLQKHGLVAKEKAPDPAPAKPAEAAPEARPAPKPVAAKTPEAVEAKVPETKTPPKAPAPEAPSAAQPGPKPKAVAPAKDAAPAKEAAAPKPAGKSSVQAKLQAVVKPVPTKPTAKGSPKSQIAAATAKAKAGNEAPPAKPKAAAPAKPAAPALVPVADTPSLEDGARDALVEVSKRLRETGLGLTRGEAPTPKDVLSRSIEAIDHVSERLTPLGAKSHPAVSRALEAAGYAADILHLLKAEDKECDMVETVSLLLQVKRGIDADLTGLQSKGGKS